MAHRSDSASGYPALSLFIFALLFFPAVYVPESWFPRQYIISILDFKTWDTWIIIFDSEIFEGCWQGMTVIMCCYCLYCWRCDMFQGPCSRSSAEVTRGHQHHIITPPPGQIRHRVAYRRFCPLFHHGHVSIFVQQKITRLRQYGIRFWSVSTAADLVSILRK